MHAPQPHCVLFTKKSHLNHYHDIQPLVCVWHDTLWASPWPERQWRCHKQNPFPIKFIVSAWAYLLLHRASECSADPLTLSYHHNDVPYAPIHGAALLMYCCVSYMHTLSHTQAHSPPHTHKGNNTGTYKDTRAIKQNKKIQPETHKHTHAPECSHSLNLPIVRVKSLPVSKQQFNTFHSHCRYTSISIIVAIATASQSLNCG